MRFLDFGTSRLEYGQEAIMPFYFFRHPEKNVITFLRGAIDARSRQPIMK